VGSCGNKWLLSDKLRGDFQFDGYVTGDCRAVGDGSYKNISHGVEDTIRVTMEAGSGNLDIDRSILPAFLGSTASNLRRGTDMRCFFLWCS